MPPNKTVILGEASESDSEDIDLDSKTDGISANKQDKHDETPGHKQIISPEQDSKPMGWSKGGIGKLGSSLFASLSSASNLAKIVASSSNNFLNPLGIPHSEQQQQKQQLRQQQYHREQPSTHRSQQSINSQPLPNDQLPILHKTLYAKNEQFHACLKHLQRHPYEKASKDLHGISQRLVNAQRIIQDLDIMANRFEGITQEIDKNQVTICK